MDEMDNRRSERMVERLADVTAAYGADPSRWPEGERAALLDIIAGMDAAAEQLDEERALDRLLDMVPPPEPPPGAVERVLGAAGVTVSDAQVIQLHRRQPTVSVGLKIRPAIGLIAASLLLGAITGTTHLADPLFLDQLGERRIDVDDLDTALIDLGFGMDDLDFEGEDL